MGDGAQRPGRHGGRRPPACTRSSLRSRRERARRHRVALAVDLDPVQHAQAPADLVLGAHPLAAADLSPRSRPSRSASRSADDAPGRAARRAAAAGVRRRARSRPPRPRSPAGPPDGAPPGPWASGSSAPAAVQAACGGAEGDQRDGLVRAGSRAATRRGPRQRTGPSSKPAGDPLQAIRSRQPSPPPSPRSRSPRRRGLRARGAPAARRPSSATGATSVWNSWSATSSATTLTTGASSLIP